MAYNTLHTVVTDYLSDQEKYTTHEYLRLLNIANRGLKELTFDILGNTKVVLLEVDSSLRVDLPDDYVDYNFIGVLNNNYTLEPLGFNKKIPVSGDENINSKLYNEVVAASGGLFGLGGGQNSNGYYAPQIDKEEWQIILGSTLVGLTIYLEYISDGTDYSSESVIHPYAEEALVSYLYWKDIQRKKYVSESEKVLARKDFYNEKRKARARLCAFTKDEAIQVIRTNYKQTPRT